MKTVAVILKTVVIAVGCVTGLSITLQAEIITQSTSFQIVDLGAGVKPKAINNLGAVVGQGLDGQAFLWQNHVYTSLGTLGGSQSYANAINDQNLVVGWSHDSSGLRRAFSWNGSTLNNIGTAFTAETVAEAVNQSGEIVGWRDNGVNFRSMRWDDVRPDGQLLFTNTGNKALGINDGGGTVGITTQASFFPPTISRSPTASTILIKSSACPAARDLSTSQRLNRS